MILLCINIMAQYDGNKNFILFEDDFNTSGRTWDANSYIESEGNWRAHFKGSITHGANEHQAYQRSQAVFDENNEMLLLIADYVSNTDLECYDLEIPIGANCSINSDYSIRYHSGAIQSIEKSFLYGYFEIKCKLPVHRGAFPAFWLWSACNETEANCDDPHYEEIDIFEYSWFITDTSLYKNSEAEYLGDSCAFTAGIYINDTGLGDSLWWQRTARIYSRIPDGNPSIDQWNTWGCLWMPDKVEWYFNGEIVNSYYDADNIPHNPMYLMANYAIDDYVVLYNTSTEQRMDSVAEFDTDYDVFYQTNDTMYIDYIRVYQPQWDCTSVVIDEQEDLDNYVYGIKKSVIIDSSNNTPIIVEANTKIDIMASEFVSITGPFQINTGAEFSIAMQKCPE